MPTNRLTPVGLILDTKTVALWSFEETAPTAPAADDVGSYPLSVVGSSPSAPGQLGKARTLSSGNHFQSPTSPGSLASVFQGEWTFEALVWIDPAAPIANRIIFSYQGTGGTGGANNVQGRLFLDAYGKLNSQWIAGTNTSIVANGISSLRNGSGWNLVGLRKRAIGGQFAVDFFINGKLDATVTGLGNATGGTSATWGIGDWVAAGAFQPFVGLIDGTRFSKVARSDAEMLDSWNRCFNNPPLVATQPAPFSHQANRTMWTGLIRPIRDADLDQGRALLQRFLARQEYLADQTAAKITSLKTIDNFRWLPDQYVQYLKDHVGLTRDLDKITSKLSPALLRKFAIGAVGLWKRRGTPQSLMDMVRLLTGRSAVYNDWFMYRSILGESSISGDGAGTGTDLYLQGGSVSAFDEFYSNLRVMDVGIKPVGYAPDASALLAYHLNDVSGFDSAKGNTLFALTQVIWNFIPWSQAFDNAAWTKTAGSFVSPNVIAAPDGTTTADLFNEGVPPAPPVLNSVTPSTTGGTLAAGTYYVVVSPILLGEEGLPSNEMSAVTTGATSSLAVAWTASPTATSYRVWIGTTPGTEGQYFAVGNVTSITLTSLVGTAGAPLTTTAKQHYAAVNTVLVEIPGEYRCHSVHVRANNLPNIRWLCNQFDEGIKFNLGTGVIDGVIGVRVMASGVIPLPNGWYRIWFTRRCDASAIAVGSHISAAPDASYGSSYVGTNRSFYVWGAQNERVSDFNGPSAYIPTTNFMASAQVFNNQLPTVPSSQGLRNLFAWSQDLTRGVWHSESGNSQPGVMAQAATTLDGLGRGYKLNDSIINGIHYIEQDENCQAGTSYVSSWYVQAAEYSVLYMINTGPFASQPIVQFDLVGQTATIQSGSVIAAGVQKVGGGWYRVWMAAITSSAGVGQFYLELGKDLVSSRNFSGTGANGVYIADPQLEVGFGPPTPYQQTPLFYPAPGLPGALQTKGEGGAKVAGNAALDAAFASGNWTIMAAALIDPYKVAASSRTNLLTRSGAIGFTPDWSVIQATGTGVVPVVTLNATTAPDGTTNASRIQLDRGVGTTLTDLSRLLYNNASGITPNQPHVFSVWLKSATGLVQTAAIEMQSGTKITISVGPNWQRYAVIATPVVTSGSVAYISTRGTYGTDQQLDLYAWGAQVEIGINPTAYIPTTSAPVTVSSSATQFPGGGNAPDGTLMTYWTPGSEHWLRFSATGTIQFSATFAGFVVGPDWSNIAKGTWHHYAVRSTATGGGLATLDFFIDGTLRASVPGMAITVPNPAGPHAMYFGSENGSQANAFAGSLGEINFSNISRPASDIQAAAAAMATSSDSTAAQLILDITNLCRPISERTEVEMLDFLDLFDDGSRTRWRNITPGTNGIGTVDANKNFNLSVGCEEEMIISTVQNLAQFPGYTTSHRFRLGAAGNKHQLRVFLGDDGAHYLVSITPTAVSINRYDNLGVVRFTWLYTYAAPHQPLSANVDYGLRIDAINVSGTVNIKVYIDGSMMLEANDTAPTSTGGAFRILAPSVASNPSQSGINTIDNVELSRLPMRSALVAPSGYTYTSNFLTG